MRCLITKLLLIVVVIAILFGVRTEHAQDHQVEDKQVEHQIQFVRHVKSQDLLLRYNF